MKNKKILDRIAQIVANEHKMEVHEIFENTRRRDLTDIRSMFHYLAHKYSEESLQSIGNYSFLAGRDKPHNHASVLHGKNKIMSFVVYDRDIAERVERMENRVIDYTNNSKHFKKRKQTQITKIVDLVFADKDEDFINMIYQVVTKSYRSKDKSTLKQCIRHLDQKYYEGIYQTTQNDSGVGVVQGSEN